jgi:hypothetical protein
MAVDDAALNVDRPDERERRRTRRPVPAGAGLSRAAPIDHAGANDDPFARHDRQRPPEKSQSMSIVNSGLRDTLDDRSST